MSRTLTLKSDDSILQRKVDSNFRFYRNCKHGYQIIDKRYLKEKIHNDNCKLQIFIVSLYFFVIIVSDRFK